MLWLDPLFLAFEEFVLHLRAFLPTLFSALAIIAGGVIAAVALKIIVLRLLHGIGLIVARAPGMRRSRGPRLPWPLSVIIANLVFWLTVLFFIAVAMHTAGLPGIANFLSGAARHLPRVLFAAVIVLLGYFLAVNARDSCLRLGRRARSAANIVYVLILAITALAALRQFGVDLVIVRWMILIVFAAVSAGLALAFGTGAARSLDNIIAAHYVRRVYRPGNRVRIGTLEGEILEISPTAVVLDTAQGRTLVPAKRFNDDVSVFLGKEDEHGAA